LSCHVSMRSSSNDTESSKLKFVNMTVKFNEYVTS
jgi:hypothetical protein